jgi:hypothetical protein
MEYVLHYTQFNSSALVLLDMSCTNIKCLLGFIDWSSSDAPKDKSYEPPWEKFLDLAPSQMLEFIDTSNFPSDNPIRISEPLYLPFPDLQRLAIWILRSCKDKLMPDEHRFRWKGQHSPKSIHVIDEDGHPDTYLDPSEIRIDTPDTTGDEPLDAVETSCLKRKVDDDEMTQVMERKLHS